VVEQRLHHSARLAGAFRRLEDNCLARLFWTSLLLLHVPALLSLAAQIGHAPGDSCLSLLVRLAGLSLSALLFLLKMVDVPWLRLPSGWRRAAAAVALIGVIHTGVFYRAVEGRLDGSQARVGLVLFVGAVWKSDRLKEGLDLLSPAAACADRNRTKRLGLCPVAARTRESDCILTLFFVPSKTGPRAPPVRV
jgi:hypothetical protein